VYRIRIEVVVDVDAVDVVSLGDVHDGPHRTASDVGVARIHPQKSIVAPDRRGILLRDVRRRERGVSRVRGAIRIEPRVQLEPALVRLLDREREWIPRRLRRAALPPGEKLRPRFVRRCVERISTRTNLKYHGVEME